MPDKNVVLDFKSAKKRRKDKRPIGRTGFASQAEEAHVQFVEALAALSLQADEKGIPMKLQAQMLREIADGMENV